MSIKKAIPVVVNIEMAGDNKCIVVFADDSEVPLTKGEIKSLFQDTSSEVEVDDH